MPTTSTDFLNIPATAVPPRYMFVAGLVFAALLILFFMIAFFRGRNLSSGQLQILRFLGALCTGFSAGLFTGTATFQAQGVFAGLTILASGTAGCAGFMLVWFTWRPLPSNVSVVAGLTFKETARMVADTEPATVELIGFSTAHEAAAVRGKLHASSTAEALGRLRLLVDGVAIPEYQVEGQAGEYRLIATAGAANGESHPSA